jgi:hypothetical protein
VPHHLHLECEMCVYMWRFLLAMQRSGLI